MESYDRAMEGRDENGSDLWLHSPHFEPGFEEELSRRIRRTTQGTGETTDTPRMKAATLELTFDGRILQRGFWLYVWEITPTDGQPLYYVGRTGDNSSPNAQSPFNRMGQHLGFLENSNMLRRHLVACGVKPEQCRFRLVAHGPIEAESPREEGLAAHYERRDRVAPLEKSLAEAMSQAGYRVMNEVRARKPLDAQCFAEIRAAFSEAFPRLAASALE